MAAEPMRFWGWGDARRRARRCRRTRRPGSPSGSAARSRPRRGPRGASRTCGCRRRRWARTRAGRCAAAVGEDGGARRPRRARAPRRGQVLPRPRAPARRASRTGRPTPSSLPADHDAGAGGARGLRARGRRGRALRRRHERRRRRRPRARRLRGRRRPRPRAAGRRRDVDAVSGWRGSAPGLRVAELERAARRARPDARALAAELRVRDGRRLRGDALGRPGVDRATGASTSSSAGCARAAPAGELEVAPCPASAAGPDLRELLLGSEGALGVLTR